MGCCVALAYLVALVRRAWFAVAPRPDVMATSFAPPASRPAPGGPAVAVGPAPVRLPARTAWAPALVITGLAWFLVGIVGMHALGWFAWAQTSLLADTAFHTSGLWLAAGGLAVQVVRG